MGGRRGWKSNDSLVGPPRPGAEFHWIHTRRDNVPMPESSEVRERPVDPAAEHKTALRRRLRAARRERAAVRADHRETDADSLASHTLAYLAGLPGPVHCVAAFESLPTETPTHRLVDTLRSSGIRVLLPVLLPDLDLDWRELNGSLHDPLGCNAIAQADAILVPAMSIDSGGRRLGQGGGSYDRALPRRRPGVQVVALIDDDEFSLEPLPMNSLDQGVDGCITPQAGYRRLPHRQHDLRH